MWAQGFGKGTGLGLCLCDKSVDFLKAISLSFLLVLL